MTGPSVPREQDLGRREPIREAAVGHRPARRAGHRDGAAVRPGGAVDRGSRVEVGGEARCGRQVGGEGGQARRFARFAHQLQGLAAALREHGAADRDAWNAGPADADDRAGRVADDRAGHLGAGGDLGREEAHLARPPPGVGRAVRRGHRDALATVELEGDPGGVAAQRAGNALAPPQQARIVGVDGRRRAVAGRGAAERHAQRLALIGHEQFFDGDGAGVATRARADR